MADVNQAYKNPSVDLAADFPVDPIIPSTQSIPDIVTVEFAGGEGAVGLMLPTTPAWENVHIEVVLTGVFASEVDSVVVGDSGKGIGPPLSSIPQLGMSYARGEYAYLRNAAGVWAWVVIDLGIPNYDPIP